MWNKETDIKNSAFNVVLKLVDKKKKKIHTKFVLKIIFERKILELKVEFPCPIPNYVFIITELLLCLNLFVTSNILSLIPLLRKHLPVPSQQ